MGNIHDYENVSANASFKEVELQERSFVGKVVTGAVIVGATASNTFAAGLLGTIPAIDLTDFGAGSLVVLTAIGAVAAVGLVIKVFKKV